MAGSKVIGRVEIKVSARVDNSRPNMQREMDRDLDRMQRRAERRRPIKIPVDLDDRELRRKLDDLNRKDRDRDKELFKVVADFDYSKVERGTEAMRKKLKSVERSKVTIDLNKGAFDRRMQNLNKNLRVKAGVDLEEGSLDKAKRRIDRFRHDAQKKIEMPVGLSGMALAAARLSWLTRPRRVSIIATVNAKSAVVALGMLKSLAGINTLRKFGESLEDIVTDFDRFAYSITKVMTLLGSLNNVLGYAATSLVSIGGGVAQIGQLTAVLPTLAASALSVFGVLRIGFNNFAESFSDVPDVAEAALAKLPPTARKARDALVGVFRDFQDPIQDLFWENIGDGVERFALVVVPRVQAGMMKITPAVAKMTGEVLRSFEQIAKNKSMDTMFDNLAIGLEKATRGVKPFFDALNILGFRGSFFLGRIGKALGDMGQDFFEFIDHAEKMGHIEGWINTGWKALKDFGGTLIAVKDQFKALTQIIDAAGGQSLAGFRRNMEGWARFFEQEPFRSRMVRMFRGARDGASELAAGVRAMADVFGRASYQVEALEVQLGRIGRGALERISDILGRRMLQTGLLSGLLKVEQALRIIKPSAQAMGDIFGHMFDVAGSVLVGVAPMLNQVTDILRTIVVQLAPALKDTIPTLAQFLRGIIELGGGGLQLATTVLTGVLNVVNALPGPLQSLVLAFGTFLALRGRLGGMMSALDMFWNRQRTSFAGGVAVVESNAQKFARSYDRVVRTVERGGTRIGNALRTGGLHMVYGTGARFEREFAQMSAAANTHTSKMATAFGRVRTAISGFGKAMSGIMAFGGGLGGMLVFTGIIAAISAIGQAAAKEKEEIRELQSTLDEFGNTTAETRKKVAEWMQDTKVARFDNLIKAFEDVGIASQDVIDGLSNGREAYDSFSKSVETGYRNAIAESERYNASMKEIDPSFISDAHSQELALTADTWNSLRLKVNEYGDKISQAQTRQEQIAKAMGVTNQEAKDLDEAMRSLGSEYSSSAQQATALGRAMDILNGSMKESDDATLAAADAVRGLRDAIKEATTGEGKISLKDMIDADTGIIDISFKGDPTGQFAKIQSSMRQTIETGISEGIDRGTKAPPSGKLSALKASYEQSLRNLKAEILPQLGKGGEKKLDSWLKANGYEWDTIEAIVTGKLDDAEMAKIPAEARKLITSLVGSDPWVDVPIDGDYLPLRGKMTTAEGMLEKLGATKVNPTIDADGKPLSKVTVSALDALREIDGMDAQAILDAKDIGLSAKQQKALRELYQIDSFEAIPRFDADGQPLSEEHRLAMAKILGLDGKEAEAFLKADSAQLQEEVAKADREMDMVKQDAPAKLEADGSPARMEGETTQQYINRMRQDRAIPIDADGNPARQEGAKTKGSIDDLYQSRPIPINANGQPAKKEGETTEQYINRLRQKRAIPVDANGRNAKQESNEVQKKIDGIKQRLVPSLRANAGPANREIAGAQGRLNTFDRTRATAQAIAQVSGSGNVANLLNLIRSLKSKSVTITSIYKQVGRPPAGGPGGRGGPTAADGGILGRYSPYPVAWKSFASGGIQSKPMTAHIAPGGSYVTYAEKETGGEAFIPLASSKRARSTKILAEVAKMFGYDLNRKYMANGGVNGNTTVSRSADVSIGQLIAADPDEAVRRIRDAQRQAQALLNIGGGL